MDNLVHFTSGTKLSPFPYTCTASETISQVTATQLNLLVSINLAFLHSKNTDRIDNNNYHCRLRQIWFDTKYNSMVMATSNTGAVTLFDTNTRQRGAASCDVLEALPSVADPSQPTSRPQVMIIMQTAASECRLKET